MLSSKLHSSIGNTDRLYVDDVFSAYTYTGNGSTQTINNGIDLAGEGGMVWLKSRDLANAQMLYDTIRGGNQHLSTNATHTQLDRTPSITSWNQNGFSVAGNDGNISYPGHNYISWTFRKAPKFFDVVTYTGNGTSSRAIAHSLGQEVGMVMTKATSTAGNWNTYHRSATGDLVLNGNNAQTGSKALVNSATTSTFTVSGAANTNAVTYVAYLFAHDTSADGFIQCGSFTTDSSGNATVNLGWEPQYLMLKRTDGVANWQIYDTMRSWSNTSYGQLCADSSSPEAVATNTNGAGPVPTATGFTVKAGVLSASAQYIYLAIRRPNKPPTTGTQVYNAVAYTGNSTLPRVLTTGIVADLSISKSRIVNAGGGQNSFFVDRLRGAGVTLAANMSSAEDADNGFYFDQQDGVRFVTGTSNKHNNAGIDYIHYAFRRAPGFFDVVCYTGTGSNRTVNHSLGVAPELVIVKSRGNAQSWHVFGSVLPGGYGTASSNPILYLNLTNVVATGYPGLAAAPTSSLLSLDQTYLSASGYTYVAYLFASLPGISKIGSYTGNGTTQTIDCGFTTGARFILIRRTDAAGDWYVWDTVRGLVAGNDPHLSLNSSAAEITTNDSIDPESTGFIVNQVTATNINVTSATYLYLAIA